MTTRPKTLSHAARIVLLLILVLVPGIARSQSQKEPPVAKPEKNAEEPVEQKPGSLITPGTKQEAEAVSKPTETAAPVAPPVEAKAPPVPEETAPYVIKQGDTLWDIANALMKDPFLWPFIWKANPAITNPDLIYPGNKLTIPSLAPIERALQAPAEPGPKEEVEKAAEEQAPPKALRREGIAGAEVTRPKPLRPEGEEAPAEEARLIIPEEQPVPVIDKYSMLSAGFVDQEKTTDVVLRGREESKTTLSYDDLVYVRIHDPENVAIGDKYLIYLPLNRVKHPKTGERFGRLIRVLGILQITAKDSPDALTARITLSFDAIEKNALLTPYQEPVLLYQSAEKKAKDITGYILEVTDRRSINAQTDIVYLDKGSFDGVDAGDQFIVYAGQENRGFPRKKIGEVQVILVKERTSTAVVRTSTDTMARGDSVDFKR